MPIQQEATLNLAISRLLDGMRRNWRISAEETRVFPEEPQLRPDIVVWRGDIPTLLIENEFTPANSVEEDARARLGKEMSGGRVVRSVVALRSPAGLKTVDQGALEKAAAAAEFDFALFSGIDELIRFPESGWLSGELTNLAGFVYRASIPAEAVQKAAISLEFAVQNAEKILASAGKTHPDVGKKIERILQQEYGEQTRRMALTILVNALAFHNDLAGSNEIASLEELRGRNGAKARKADILQEWKKILDINYWPIFRVAQQILLSLSEAAAQGIIDLLVKSAEALTADKILKSHDLFGQVFQRLIADRKFLATFYTRPPSAALLANLAIPEDAPFAGGKWGSASDATDYVVADFACGTGTLLSAAYQRIGELHEQAGGDASAIHPAMMEKALIGCDVMPAAVHLTASILSGAHPNRIFDDTRLDTVPYGEPKKGEFRIGSLELLAKQEFLPVLSTSSKRQRGAGEEKESAQIIHWRSANLVIMNPPFTRPTNHEGVHKNIPNPAFAAFGADAELQKALGERSKKLRTGTCGSGNAGIASDFVALADKMIRPGGMMALVLPLSALAGESWKKTREMWAQNYEDICVVTLSASGGKESAFSADTNMSEILFIGRRINGREANACPRRYRAAFVVLHKRPQTEMEAAQVVCIIGRALRKKSIHKLEDGPVGGSFLMAGKSDIGGILDAPIPKTQGDPWTIARLRDFSLAQTAYALSHGRLWIPGAPESEATDIPICRLDRFAKRGFISRDISGVDGVTQKPRGPFDIKSLSSPAATYPCLWGHDAARESTMLVEPDSEGAIRKGMKDRAHEVWKTASRAHCSIGFRFNSQPLAVAMTEQPSLGGPGWLNVALKKHEHEFAYALWGNSTLGLLMYWWWANKQQDGRGQISPLRFEGMPTLDAARLSRPQLAAARKGFDAMKKKPMLPFYRADQDPTRAELDRVILCDVLGFPARILDGIDLLRRKLCAEPSIRGGKE